MPHIWRGFLSPACYVLHRIAFAVVSEWYQYHPRIRVTLLSTSSSFEIGVVNCASLNGGPKLVEGPFSEIRRKRKARVLSKPRPKNTGYTRLVSTGSALTKSLAATALTPLRRNPPAPGLPPR